MVISDMRGAYFDCFAGVSGDMIIGSLIDAGLEFDQFKHALAEIPLTGYEMAVEKVERCGIQCARFVVQSNESEIHRNLSDILKIIESSALDHGIKERAAAIFKRIASVEAKIHNKKIEEIHFHEIGAIDSIVDIVGAVIALDLLGLETIHASRINVGGGFINTNHGLMPVPAPATAELLLGIPVYSDGAMTELTTPTGAAIISHVSNQFGSLPDMKIHSVGYGAGARDLSFPNALRVYIGEIAINSFYEKIISLETNIDDMNPEFYQYITEKLFQSGALDVFTIPIMMKKSRPGVLLTVISTHATMDKLMDVLFDETTTAGVRISAHDRKILGREIQKVTTRYGPVGVKVLMHTGRVVTVAPEYEDCRNIAQQSGILLKNVYDEAKKEALVLLKK
jgi:uncharacterized protein (TIGR00299 family) protein